MTEIKHHTIRANDIRQHYMEAGEGAPVILLHGFPETSYAWRHQVPELAKKYRVIAPDLRGYGESDKPATGYDKRNMAKDLRELMRALDIPKIALVGHDRGARVATRFAIGAPALCVARLPTIAPTRRMSLKTASMLIRRSCVRLSRYGEPISTRWVKCSICQRSGLKWRRT